MANNTGKEEKVATPETLRHCKIESASITDSVGGDGAYDLLGVEGGPEEVGAKILESLRECDLCVGRNSQLDAGETITLNVHIQIRKVRVPEILPTINHDTPWFIRYDDGKVCPEGGWTSREKAQAFLDAEVGVPAHVELFI